MSRQELVQKAKEMGISKPQTIKTAMLETMVKESKNTKSNTSKPKIESMTIGRGRKVNPNSVRQMRLKELNEKRENGLLRKGRSINPTSARQIRLTEMELKRQNGELRRGRPAKTEKASK